MAARNFFPKSWIGRELAFTWPQPSNWRIMEKVSEKYLQFNLDDVENPSIVGSKVSFADAAFLCENTSHPGEEIFIKVFKQIPHHETEFEAPAIRREQAGTRTHAEIEAYKWFRENNARKLPICLGHKMEQQGDFDAVPGGYVHYLAYSKFPGLRLDKTRFWALDDDEREGVRHAFRVTYGELHSLGLVPTFFGLKHMVWDKETASLYIVDFAYSHKMSPNDVWKWTVSADWGLFKPREENDEYWVEGYDFDRMIR